MLRLAPVLVLLALALSVPPSAEAGSCRFRGDSISAKGVPCRVAVKVMGTCVDTLTGTKGFRCRMTVSTGSEGVSYLCNKGGKRISYNPK